MFFKEYTGFNDDKLEILYTNKQLKDGEYKNNSSYIRTAVYNKE